MMAGPVDWPEAAVEIGRLRELQGKSLTDAGVLRAQRESSGRLYELARANATRALQLLEDQYLSFGAAEPDTNVLGALVGGLVAAGRRDAAPLLARMLGDPRMAALREDLAEDLGRLGNAAGGPALEQALADPAVWVRAKAARSLGALNYRAAIDALVSRLADPAGEVRASVARALGEIGAGTAALALREVAEKDEDEEVKEAAAKALTRLNHSH